MERPALFKGQTDLQIATLWSSYYAIVVIELGQEIKAARQP
jgi:hypothetical protein